MTLTNISSGFTLHSLARLKELILRGKNTDTEIHISYNDNLATVEDDAFKNVADLSDLRLFHNKLSSLILANPSSLRSLQLAGNE